MEQPEIIEPIQQAESQFDEVTQAPNQHILQTPVDQAAQQITTQKEDTIKQEVLHPVKEIESNITQTKQNNFHQLIDAQILTPKSQIETINLKQVSNIKQEQLEENQKQKIERQIQTPTPAPTPTPQPLPQNKSIKKRQKQSNLFHSIHLIKKVYVHFCKQNNISAMRSSLFQDKLKILEEMSLNKWMVFCKQFDIFQTLCSLKINKKRNSKDIGTPVKAYDELIKIKQIKETQEILINIFKEASDHMTKMKFDHFIRAIKLLRQQFNKFMQNQSKSQDEFIKSYLYCSTQQQCMKKLSTLKFTFRIPEIEYNKAKSMTTNSKNTCKNDKQNQIKRIENQLPPKRSSKLTLNKVIRQAKNIVQTKNGPKISLIKKGEPKMHPILGQENTKKDLQRPKIKSELHDYFDSTHDDFLESYFKNEQVRFH